MSNFLDALKAAIGGSPKKATDAMAAPVSVAGAIRARRDAALEAADSDDPQATLARLTRQQHSPHNAPNND